MNKDFTFAEGSIALIKEVGVGPFMAYGVVNGYCKPEDLDRIYGEILEELVEKQRFEDCKFLKEEFCKFKVKIQDALYV